MADKKPAVVGSNGGQVMTLSHAAELDKAKDVARRYRCEFVDLQNFQLHHDLFRKVPVHLMFRYNFVPLEETEDGRLAIAIADPSQLMMIDEISLLLGQRIITKVSRRPSSRSAFWKMPAKASRSTLFARTKDRPTRAFRSTG
jgi:hypothetical protein